MGRGNIFKGVKSIDFYHRFNSEEPYYEYLSEIKWKDDYVCKKCENIHYCKGRLSYSRHCTRCKYDESPTARTMFDKCKFSIEQTFHIAFKISTKKKACLHWSCLKNMVCVRKLVGNLNGKYNKQCKALKTHLFTEEVHIENSMLVKRKKVSLDKKQEKETHCCCLRNARSRVWQSLCSSYRRCFL